MRLPRPAALDADARSCEWVFPRGAPAPWTSRPGSVLHDGAGAVAMNIAPSRWLVLGGAQSWRDAALAAGALEFDTTGRWRLLEFARRSAALRAALDVEAALTERGCITTTLFDTPAIIASHEGFGLLLVCVPASHCASFLQQVSAIESRHGGDVQCPALSTLPGCLPVG